MRAKLARLRRPIWKQPVAWLPALVVIVVVATAGAYVVAQINRQQTADKLGWSPDPDSNPGPDTAPKPSLGGKTNLQNDEQVFPTMSPTPTPSPGEPSIDLRVADDAVGNLGIYTDPGLSSKVVWIKMAAKNFDLSACTLTDEVILDDEQFTHQTDQLTAKTYQEVSFADGLHQVTAHCLNGKVVSPTRIVRIMDRQPKLCKGFSFDDSTVTASSLAELQSGLVGTWQGCVYTPWVPPYYVTMTFNADGTYQAESSETIDGQAMVAMYYGSDSPSPEKKYAIDTFQGSMGYGYVDVFFWAGDTNRDPLSHVKLMDGKLSFDFMHHNQYGPLTFKLVRKP
jgi:hypothetical protein